MERSLLENDAGDVAAPTNEKNLNDYKFHSRFNYLQAKKTFVFGLVIGVLLAGATTIFLVFEHDAVSTMNNTTSPAGFYILFFNL